MWSTPRITTNSHSSHVLGDGPVLVALRQIAEDDFRDLGFHMKWNMGFTYDALSYFGSSFKERRSLDTFGWKRLAWRLV